MNWSIAMALYNMIKFNHTLFTAVEFNNTYELVLVMIFFFTYFTWSNSTMLYLQRSNSTIPLNWSMAMTFFPLLLFLVVFNHAVLIAVKFDHYLLWRIHILNQLIMSHYKLNHQVQYIWKLLLLGCQRMLQTCLQNLE
jgi:hypothetical protein